MDKNAAQGWLTVDEAAARLGVKPNTLYSYVSRGILHRRRSDDGHSRFDAAEVDRLARRGRPRRKAGSADVVIESAVTALGDDRPYYRGRDGLELADWCELEDIAGLLWTGWLGEAGDPAEPADPTAEFQRPWRYQVWRAVPQGVVTGRQAQAGLPPDVLPLERLQVIAPTLASLDPLRLTLDPSAVVDTGKSLIAGMVDCLPDLGGPSAGPISARLWPKLTAAEPTPELIDALRTALVLTADHELAASTLAVRVAASVRADPYAAVSAGLGVTGGALHGGASLGAEAMLAEAADASQAKYVMGQRLRRGERIPGFGHTIYAAGDGRAGILLDRIRDAVPTHKQLAVAEAILDEARRRRLPEVNIDFALAVLVNVSGMAPGSGEAIFAIARTVGWLAHAMEEYAKPTRLRLRAAYMGPLP